MTSGGLRVLEIDVTGQAALEGPASHMGRERGDGAGSTAGRM